MSKTPSMYQKTLESVARADLPMTTNDWVKERAQRLLLSLDTPGHAHGLFERGLGRTTAALQEAIERGKAERPMHPGEVVVLRTELDKLFEAKDALAEERAHATKALKLAKEMQDKAVAAERERYEALEAENKHLRENHTDIVRRKRATAKKRDEFEYRAHVAEAKLARLENPDEAMVEAVLNEGCLIMLNETAARRECAKVIRALAAHLTGQEVCQAERLESDDPDRARWTCRKCGPNINGPCAGQEGENTDG